MSTVERALTTDPTAGLELVSGNEVNLEATRHLFLAANLLDPARQRDIGLPDGGEELVNRCLRRTDGKLPKCEITPLEFWVEWMPKDLFPEGMEHLALSLKGDQQPDGAGNRIFKPLFGYPLYPAHTIVDALGIATGERRGVVEVENLRGTDYGKEDREMQALFFPADWPKPVELRLIRERIEAVADSVADPDAKDTAGYMLTSVDQSTEYMLQIVSVAQTQLAERVTHQFVHRLTPKVRSFMAQLEIKPPVAAQMQDAVNKAVTASLPPEVLEQLNANSAALANLGPQLSEAIGNAVQQAITAALGQAAKAPAKTKPSE
jgi:hypothetical protein